MNLATAVDEYLLAAAADGLKQATLKWYASVFKELVRVLGGGDLATITPKQLREYIVGLRQRTTRYVGATQKPEQEGGLSESSIVSHVTALHALFLWCSREYTMPNPMGNIRRPPRPVAIPKAIDRNTFITIFNGAGEGIEGIRNRAILALFADSGCRLGGLCTLMIPEIELENGKAYVTEKGKHRAIQFTFFTAQLISQWLAVRPRTSSLHAFTSFKHEQGRLTESGVHQMLKRIKARTNVKGRVNPHSFRHNFAREYLKNGGDIVTLARLLGHSDINTTAAYYAVFSQNELKDMHGKYTPMNDLMPWLRSTEDEDKNEV